jgi:predicted nuclease of predicted toxin-antitoxin system
VKPKLYLDEDVSPRLADMLRSAGFDAVSARDISALGETDRQQFERARASGRTIFSYNFYDFDAIARSEAQAGRPHSGIIVSYYQYDSDQLGVLAAAIAAFLAGRGPADIANTYLVLPRRTSPGH